MVAVYPFLFLLTPLYPNAGMNVVPWVCSAGSGLKVLSEGDAAREAEGAEKAKEVKAWDKIARSN